MPSRNVIKVYAADQYYHIYSRGVAKQKIFLDAQDYGYFIGLFKRYLSPKNQISKKHGTYVNYSSIINLNAFCLMPNHFHLLVYQSESTAITQLMRSIVTSYSLYFNKRYARVGPVFQSRFKASTIDKTNYLEHISRYIHLNPSNWKNYPYSSLAYYLGSKDAEWIKPEPIMALFGASQTYQDFLEDYEGQKEILDELKWELANEINA